MVRGLDVPCPCAVDEEVLWGLFVAGQGPQSSTRAVVPLDALEGQDDVGRTSGGDATKLAKDPEQRVRDTVRGRLRPHCRASR
jgi:hypothetical protein